MDKTCADLITKIALLESIIEHQNELIKNQNIHFNKHKINQPLLWCVFLYLWFYSWLLYCAEYTLNAGGTMTKRKIKKVSKKDTLKKDAIEYILKKAVSKSNTEKAFIKVINEDN